MASLVLTGDTSGQVTLAAPAVAGTNTLTLQAATATNSVNTLATAVASTSGTSIDFTGLPSWIKRITLMLNGVSTSGTSPVRFQLGAGSAQATGYISTSQSGTTGIGPASAGFDMSNFTTATDNRYGYITFVNINGNNWVANGIFSQGTTVLVQMAGIVALTGTLDRVRMTTVNGTDTFDAGTVNILYEG
jgi:hypothetical protein